MLSALNLLVKQREACGVLKDNNYVFARPGAMSHFRGSDCLRGFAMECGAKCPKSLTSTRLRKHAATLSTVLNMTDTEMDQLANFLGHDIRIHEFYRLPEKTLQLAKISKVLMALEQGRLAEFHGKNLDEIGIDPDNVQDCDEEEECTQVEHCSSAVDTRKKTPWQQTEVQAVERHMNKFIISCTLPAKTDCERCLKAEPEALKNRDWKNLKFYIYNRITAYKK
uniref:Si:ch73-211l13.2 n=1 Tax=Stegastes partitus TaxID=144197 RepID=A0A3B4ZW97_9TELE